MAILVLTATQESIVEAKPVDARGNPAQVENPQWLAAEPETITVVPSPDGNPLKAIVRATGPVDEATQVRFEADAKMGEGTVALFGMLDVVVTGGTAVGVELTAAPPTEQQPA